MVFGKEEIYFLEEYIYKLLKIFSFFGVCMLKGVGDDVIIGFIGLV